jgi:signal transduction histidine kinase/AmiR/NasT family two-component response regulator
MEELRVLVYPPSRRDGDATLALLARADVPAVICSDGAQVAAEIDRGAGALVLTDLALVPPHIDAMRLALAQQPQWSDLPIILLGPAVDQIVRVTRAIQEFTNVTLLERPASARILLSAVQAALRARQRQYEMREQLEALQVAEERLVASERELRAADQRKDEFLAMLAHELRNPLAPMRNVGEILGQTAVGNPRLKSLAEILKRQLTHMVRIVDDLLDVSRVTQGRIELQRSTIDLAQVIADALESVAPLMLEREHAVEVEAERAAVYVDGDHARLVQCVSNLLTNAAKYTDKGGHISVTLVATGREACISVADNGIGIPPQLLPQVFELFVQSARSLDRAQGGLGIGLSVVRRLVQMHEGRIQADSEGVGRGSRFEIYLPRVAAPTQRNMRTPAVTPRQLKRILVVDDNQDSADSLRMILGALGHEVRVVYSARSAIAAVEEELPDVVLLDIGLPEMDGYEVAAMIRKRHPHAHLVALTGYGQPEDVRRASAAGFSAHMVKPVDLAELELVLSSPDSSTRVDSATAFELAHRKLVQ